MARNSLLCADVPLSNYSLTLTGLGSVATHLRCGGIFSYSIITNVLLILTVKKIEN